MRAVDVSQGPGLCGRETHTTSQRPRTFLETSKQCQHVDNSETKLTRYTVRMLVCLKKFEELSNWMFFGCPFFAPISWFKRPIFALFYRSSK